jgi:hypothetical protein
VYFAKKIPARFYANSYLRVVITYVRGKYEYIVRYPQRVCANLLCFFEISPRRSNTLRILPENYGRKIRTG